MVNVREEWPMEMGWMDGRKMEGSGATCGPTDDVDTD